MPDTTTWYVGVKGHKKAGVWNAKEEGDYEALTSERVGFTTVLSINYRFGPNNPPPGDSLYRGPFYVDLDVEESLATAIRAAKTVVKTLKGNGVQEQDIRVWLSGKKGFHITVHPGVFDSEWEKGRAHLPAIYKLLASDLKLPPDAMDYRVYSELRGRMWRRPGVKRIDNAKYKVPISVEELQNLTVTGYGELISAPREEFPPIKNPTFSVAMNALFRRAIGHYESLPARKTQFIDPEIRELLHGELPPCAQKMLEGDVDTSKGFNAISIQFAKAVASFAPHRAEELISEFAANNTGTSYNTEEKRRRHTMTAFRIATNPSSGYGWSCRSARSVLKDDPCFDCPVRHLLDVEDDEDDDSIPERSVALAKLKSESLKETQAKFIEDDDIPERSVALAQLKAQKEAESPAETQAQVPWEDDISDLLEESPELPSEAQTESPTETQETQEVDYYNEHGLIPTAEGYAFVGDKGVLRHVSNFILKPEKYFVEFIPSVGMDRRTAMMAGVYIENQKVGSAIIEESNWMSRTGFISSFLGLSNTSFFGKDDDVQKMRQVIVKNLESTAQKIRRVAATGIHHERVADTDVFTLVEPGWSLNNLGMVNTYILQGKAKEFQPLTHEMNQEPLPAAQAKILVQALQNINERTAAAIMVGWNLSCHLKVHLMLARREFPLLSVSGNASSGKTSGSELIAAVVHGSPYTSTANALSLPGASPFGIWSTVASSMTTPVLLDEYNKSRIGGKKYTDVGEILKAAYQRATIVKGTLARSGNDRNPHGANLIEYPLTAPLAILSEQAIVVPALVQRSVQVSLAPANLSLEGVRESFDELRSDWDRAHRFARTLTLEALHLPAETAQGWLAESLKRIDLEIGDRPQLCYATLLVGLEFLKFVSQKHGWGVESMADEMAAAIVEYTQPNNEAQDNLAKITSRSEVDAVLEAFSNLAASVVDDKSSYRMEEGLHYHVEGDSLYIYPALSFLEYRKYMAHIERAEPAINNLSAMTALLKNEPYCVSVRAVCPGFANDRQVWKLSISKLEKKGIAVEMFQ